MLTFKENNSNYVDTIKSWIYSKDIINEDLLLFESSYVIIGNVEKCTELIANYNLFIIGNLNVAKVHVKKDLYVLGNIETEELIVNGNITCAKDLKSKSIKVGRSMTSLLLQTDITEVGQNLLIENAFVNNKLDVSNEIICLEGMIGSGLCKAKSILIKEYKAIEIECEKFILLNEEFNSKQDNKVKNSNLSRLMVGNLFEDTSIMKEYGGIQGDLNKFLVDSLDAYVTDDIESKYDFDEIDQKFHIIKNNLPYLSSYVENYKQILRVADKCSITYVEDFITLLNLKHNTPKFLYNISIVNDVLNSFYSSQKQKLAELYVQSQDIDSIIHNLYFLNQNKHLLSIKEYETLFNKLKKCLLLGDIHLPSHLEIKSTGNDELLIKLLNDIPEVKNGDVILKAISREAGSRARVAVFSPDNRIDPIGSCIGYKGERINKIIKDLDGEKISIILWSPIPEEFIKNALGITKLKNVEIDGEVALVKVPSDQYALAIGKSGINVKLASALTGYKIIVET